MSYQTDLVLRELMRTISELEVVVRNLSDCFVDATTAPRKRTPEDLATVTGLHIDTVKKYIREGKLPGYKEGERYIVPDLEFEAYRRGMWRPPTHDAEPRNLLHHVPSLKSTG